MKLSANFTLEEMERSDYAARNDINNSAPTEVIEALGALCHRVLQPLRDRVGTVTVTSGYRCPELNRAVGGAAVSAHLSGRAADIVVPGRTPLEVAQILAGINDVDKVIHEFGRWVHVQIAAPGKTPRGQLLTAVRAHGRTHYLPGLMTMAEAEERAA